MFDAFQLLKVLAHDHPHVLFQSVLHLVHPLIKGVPAQGECAARELTTLLVGFQLGQLPLPRVKVCRHAKLQPKCSF